MKFVAKIIDDWIKIGYQRIVYIEIIHLNFRILFVHFSFLCSGADQRKEKRNQKGKERRLKAYAFVKINFSKCSKWAKLNGSYFLACVFYSKIALGQRLALLWTLSVKLILTKADCL